MAEHRFTISIDVRGVSRAALRAYVLDALECWGSQRHPDEPLFNLRGAVKVRYESKTRKKPKAARKIEEVADI